MLKRTTPVPNRFFDELMIDLSASAIRVYLKIARQTLGWRNQYGEVKGRDWISHSQFSNVGVSSRSVTSAVDELLSFGLIRLTDEQGNSLADPKKRKKAKRIFYSLTDQTPAEPLYNNAKSATNTAKNYKNNAESDFRPTQNPLSTKEIFTKEYSAQNGQRIPDHIRIQQIKDEQARQQLKRNS